MSYDIRLKDPVTDETLDLPLKHVMTGGTYQADYDEQTRTFSPKPISEAWLNITYNYGHYYYEATDGDPRFSHDEISAYYADGTTGPVKTEYGIRGIYGKTGAESIAMLEDMIFCTRDFAEKNPETVKAFLYASIKGWEYAVEHPQEAAQIVYEAGSSVSQDHQNYMASEVAKLVTTDTKGNTVTDIGNMDDDAMQQTLDLAKKYVSLDDSSAQDKLQSFTLDDIRDKQYIEAAKSSDGTFKPEKSEVSIQLKWLPQAQFMGYYVADALGYYKNVGLTVNIVSGGGDISETTAVNNGTVDFGVTWVTNLASADAGGMDLLEIAQIYQRSGLELVYKPENFQ